MMTMLPVHGRRGSPLALGYWRGKRGRLAAKYRKAPCARSARIDAGASTTLHTLRAQAGIIRHERCVACCLPVCGR